MHIDPADSDCRVDTFDVVHLTLRELRSIHVQLAKFDQYVCLRVLHEVSPAYLRLVCILEREGLTGWIGRLIVLEGHILGHVDRTH